MLPGRRASILRRQKQRRRNHHLRFHINKAGSRVIKSRLLSSVSTECLPGDNEFTAILNGPNSNARHWVKPSKPNFDAQ